jgi:hypothetical protein
VFGIDENESVWTKMTARLELLSTGTKPKSLDFLGFIRPKRDFSMGYSESK